MLLRLLQLQTWLKSSDRGGAALEYGIILWLEVIITILVVGVYGPRVSHLLEWVAARI